MKQSFAQVIHRIQTPSEEQKHNILCLTETLDTPYSMHTKKTHNNKVYKVVIVSVIINSSY